MRAALAGTANSSRICGVRSALNGDSWSVERPFDLGSVQRRGTRGFQLTLERLHA
jgi:hypothetical protein